ncbi:hypothetical protein DFH08DRAFT_951381 [Mycena albidolilacea]|uniref:Uncharacterized protein n=1 Tax=Mycena albidolilacea TaxID=1033008 RepID=A0AAD7AJC3_9AGAR|nr:hypothetical protein DFH08DRAFT_951381 [Mycena albidolilacea]
MNQTIRQCACYAIPDDGGSRNVAKPPPVPITVGDLQVRWCHGPGRPATRTKPLKVFYVRANRDKGLAAMDVCESEDEAPSSSPSSSCLPHRAHRGPHQPWSGRSSNHRGLPQPAPPIRRGISRPGIPAAGATSAQHPAVTLFGTNTAVPASPASRPPRRRLSLLHRATRILDDVTNTGARRCTAGKNDDDMCFSEEHPADAMWYVTLSVRYAPTHVPQILDGGDQRRLPEYRSMNQTCMPPSLLWRLRVFEIDCPISIVSPDYLRAGALSSLHLRPRIQAPYADAGRILEMRAKRTLACLAKNTPSTLARYGPSPMLPTPSTLCWSASPREPDFPTGAACVPRSHPSMIMSVTKPIYVLDGQLLLRSDVSGSRLHTMMVFAGLDKSFGSPLHPALVLLPRRGSLPLGWLLLTTPFTGPISLATALLASDLKFGYTFVHVTSPANLYWKSDCYICTCLRYIVTENILVTDFYRTRHHRLRRQLALSSGWSYRASRVISLLSQASRSLASRTAPNRTIYPLASSNIPID